ncbi:hypothetical protein HKX48_007360 [Thoreauomyces humboldtii]|nr:hypothetical protein HKX48_007360 [Thoreauomyces humboldtii]
MLRNIEDVLMAEWNVNWALSSPKSLLDLIQAKMTDRRFLVKATLAGVLTIGVEPTRQCMERFDVL